jgi:hypothetical protein
VVHIPSGLSLIRPGLKFGVVKATICKPPGPDSLFGRTPSRTVLDLISNASERGSVTVPLAVPIELRVGHLPSDDLENFKLVRMVYSEPGVRSLAFDICGVVSMEHLMQTREDVKDFCGRASPSLRHLEWSLVAKDGPELGVDSVQLASRPLASRRHTGSGTLLIGRSWCTLRTILVCGMIGLGASSKRTVF